MICFCSDSLCYNNVLVMVWFLIRSKKPDWCGKKIKDSNIMILDSCIITIINLTFNELY